MIYNTLRYCYRQTYIIFLCLHFEQRVCRVWSGYPAVLFQNDLVFHSYSLRKTRIPTKIISTVKTSANSLFLLSLTLYTTTTAGKKF